MKFIFTHQFRCNVVLVLTYIIKKELKYQNGLFIKNKIVASDKEKNNNFIFFPPFKTIIDLVLNFMVFN